MSEKPTLPGLPARRRGDPQTEDPRTTLIYNWLRDHEVRIQKGERWSWAIPILVGALLAEALVASLVASAYLAYLVTLGLNWAGSR